MVLQIQITSVSDEVNLQRVSFLGDARICVTGNDNN